LVAANLILIPHFSHFGSAISCLIGFFVLFILDFYASLKIIKIDKKYLREKMKGIALSTLLMSLFILFLKGELQVFVLVILAGLVYFLSLYFLKVVGKEEINMLKEIFRTSKFNNLIHRNSQNL